MAAIGAEASQLSALTATLGNNPAQMSQFALLVMNVGPASEEQSTSQTTALVSVNSDLGPPETSQIAQLVAYSTDVREDNTQRAWTFDLDGHVFYVLDLGTFGTWVYDLSTKEWVKWRTEGYPIWNAQLGTTKGDQIIAADFQTPQIFLVDPTLSLDEGFRPVRRAVTGILSTRARNFTAVDMFSVSASVGDAQDNFDGTAVMTLSFSDDQGQTYYTFGIETLSTTDTTQELLYQSLGAFNRPGRIFRIEDLGGPVRISGAEAWLRDG